MSHWIEDADAVAVMPTPAAATTTKRHYFQDGNPATGKLATIVTADWLNMMQDEVLNVVEEAGLTPDKLNHAQLLEALRRLFIPARGESRLGEYKAIPDTLCLRSPVDARSQVGDATEDMDAINFRTLRKYVLENSGGRNVSKPEILAPADNAVMQSLSFKVTVSEISLLAGGLPQPAFTRYRVLNSDGTQILSFGEEPYTTTPTVIVPEAYIGGDITIIVQHEDAAEGNSPWSDHKPLKMAPVLQRKVAVTTPERLATAVRPNGLTIGVGDGAWSDGSAYQGAQSCIDIFDSATQTVVYQSGWGAYATSFAIPGGILSTSKLYWVRAQHKASSAPASNPGAELVSPQVAEHDAQAGRFTTIGATAPNIGSLTHTIPGAMKQGTSARFTITGATSVDSGTITYSLVNITGGISFSKYDGIAEGEEVTLNAPTIGGTSAPASVSIVAKSSFGGQAAPVPATLVILAQTVWVFNTVGQHQFVPLADMICDIFVGGGGARGSVYYPSSGSIGRGGGGGGAAILRNVFLSKSISYGVIVGAGGSLGSANGGTSSFGGLVSATGGASSSGSSAAPGGVGMGGTENYRGGPGGAPTTAVGLGDIAGGGGGAGLSDGGSGGGGPSIRPVAGGSPGTYIPEIGGPTGTDGVSITYAGGGKASIAGGGGGAYGSSSTAYQGNGGPGSVVVIFRSVS